MVFAALGSIILAQVTVFIQTLYHREAQLLEEMTDRVSTIVRVATIRNTLSDLTEKKTVNTLEKLVALAPIMGGRLYDTLGDPAGGFGVEPSLSRNAVASDRLYSLRSPDGNYYDIFLSQAQVGLPFDIILRLDTSQIQDEVQAYVFQRAQNSLIISVISVTILLTILTLVIIRPIIQVRKSMKASVLHPEHSDKYKLNWKRKDEIGEMSRSIDQLLTKISSVYQNDLATALDAIEQAKSPIVQYDQLGRLVAANPAALLMFGAKSVEEMAKQGDKFLVLPNRHTDRPYSVPSSIEELLHTPGGGSYMDEGLVLCNGVEIPVLIIARPVHKQNGDIQRYYANIVDISERTFRQNRLASEISKMVTEKVSMHERLETMKMVLESCVILLEAVKAEETADTERKSVMADRVITQWYRDAQDSGLIDDTELEYGILPVLRGNPDNLSKLFRQALSLTYMKSIYAKPSLSISTLTVSDQKTEFTIKDRSDEEGLVRAVEDRSASTNWKICLAAFNRMLNLEGGELTGMKEGEEENTVTFVLHTAPESSHITSSSEKVVAA